ncbi:MAG: hypothetical protein Tp132SUR00d2C45923861_12 [Prokaryotic dsDNA virus sp.]|nr:MAG: hypothetical protein Tp132SUR00d2C45923861_12 [Prokaryotic dsDNA virus sp.]|tara:strand:- start:12839 stop:13426 length:588 start_codon:yes stop_codon:yes gene_type:complete
MGKLKDLLGETPVGAGLLGGLGGAALSGLFSSFYQPEKVDIGKIQEYQAPTQALVDEQLGISRGLMDPQSAINQRLRDMLKGQGYEMSALGMSQIGKLGAQTGMSPGQIAMQQRIMSNQALGTSMANLNKMLQDRLGSGIGLLGSSIGVQRGLDENLANAYLTNLGIENQYGSSTTAGMGSGLLGGMQLALGRVS